MSPHVENACKMVSPFGGRESIFLFSHTNEFCGTRKVAREPGLACGPQKVRRWVCEGRDLAGRGPDQDCRVGKMEKVVNTRAGAVLVLAERFFFFQKASTGDRPLEEKISEGLHRGPCTGKPGVSCWRKSQPGAG